MAMTINDDSEDIAHSLELQKDLIRKRILHLQMMEKNIGGYGADAGAVG